MVKLIWDRICLGLHVIQIWLVREQWWFEVAGDKLTNVWVGCAHVVIHTYLIQLDFLLICRV